VSRGALLRAARLAAGALLALALAAGAGEALVRATGALDSGPVPRRLLAPAGLPDLPYRLRAGERLRVLGREVRVGSLGLRGPEVAEPSPGSRRVLVLGDSVAFGWGLEEAESFPARLAQALGRLGTPAEVLNAGVPGYSLPSSVALYRELAPALAPHAVLLALSLNDFTPTPGLSPLGILVAFDATPPPGWLAHSELVAFLRWRIGALRAALAPGEAADRGARAALFLRRAAIASRERFYAEEGGAGWEALERALAELRERAVAGGAALLVAIFPDEDQLEQPSERRLPQQRWAGRCAALGLRCLDLAPAFARAAAGGQLMSDLQHPNARGSEAAAAAVAPLLAPALASPTPAAEPAAAAPDRSPRPAPPVRGPRASRPGAPRTRGRAPGRAARRGRS
jgi:lysophospholipase L1-like esterase